MPRWRAERHGVGRAFVGALPGPDGDLVWLVQRGALFGERRAIRAPFPARPRERVTGDTL